MLNVKSRNMQAIILFVLLLTTTTVIYLSLSNSYYFYETSAQENEVPENTPFVVIPRKETKPARLKLFLFSLGTGAGITSIFFVMWRASSSKDESLIKTINLLFKEELGSLTLKDLEIIQIAREKKEFTVPEVSKNCRVSRTQVWRVMKKLEEKGIIEKTTKEKSSPSRGKPSKIYQYTGPEGQSS